MDNSKDLQQVQTILTPCSQSTGNDTTLILILVGWLYCSHANSCQQTLSRRSTSHYEGGRSDSLVSCVSMKAKVWIYYLRYDPAPMILATCCLCTSSQCIR